MVKLLLRNPSRHHVVEFLHEILHAFCRTSAGCHCLEQLSMIVVPV
ncbi:hypothetical protein AVEN_263668-1, partial [Araneus ventricosus]